MSNSKPSKAKLALIEGFKQLVVKSPYDKIHIADIIATADVSRSTFYEHFRCKEELLRECLEAIVAPLSHVGFEGEIDDSRVVSLMEHLRDAKEVALVMLNTETSQLMVGMLADSIAAKFANDAATSISSVMAATQIAESTLGFIRAWLNKGDSVSADAAARQLMASARVLTAFWNESLRSKDQDSRATCQ